MKTFTWTVLVVLTVFSVQTIIICRAQHTHHSFRSRDSVHDSKDASFFSKTNQINQLIKSSIQRWTPYLNLTRSSIDSRRTVRNSLGISPKNLSKLTFFLLNLLFGSTWLLFANRQSSCGWSFALRNIGIVCSGKDERNQSSLCIGRSSRCAKHHHKWISWSVRIVDGLGKSKFTIVLFVLISLKINQKKIK